MAFFWQTNGASMRESLQDCTAKRGWAKSGGIWTESSWKKFNQRPCPDGSTQSCFFYFILSLLKMISQTEIKSNAI